MELSSEYLRAEVLESCKFVENRVIGKVFFLFVVSVGGSRRAGARPVVADRWMVRRGRAPGRGRRRR